MHKQTYAGQDSSPGLFSHLQNGDDLLFLTLFYLFNKDLYKHLLYASNHSKHFININSIFKRL